MAIAAGATATARAVAERGRLAGKRALVTGASRGIGQAIAARLALEGAFVACGARRAEEGEAAVAALREAGGEGVWVPLDVTDPASVATAVERAARPERRLDIVVNNAGAGGPTPLDGDAASDELWHSILDVNLNGAWRVLRAALPFLSRGGRIVSISSISGRLGFPGESAYCASKHALIGLTRVLANELAPRRITVNAVCPGWVDTEMGRSVMAKVAREMGRPPEEAFALAEGNAPLGAVLAPSEVAGLVAYLCSDEARNLTGQAIVLDGGQVMP